MYSRFLLISLLLSMVGQAQSFTMLIGTYTGSGSKGIYVYRFDAATGQATWVNNTETAVNPSYLATSVDKKLVYAVNETGGSTPGAVSAYAFNQDNGSLTFLNKVPTGGDHPCYVSVDKNNKWVLVGNYSGGNLSAFPVNNDGSLKPYTQLIQQQGSGVLKSRQEKPHVHAVVFSPNGKYLFSPDLGTDKLMAYEFNPKEEKPLEPADVPFTESKGGSGPRHLTFHPNGKYAYLIEEMGGTVVVFKYKKGKMKFKQRISTHPQDFKGNKGSADIHVSPDGKFLYASNRGDANSIAIFAIDKKGCLTSKGFQSTMGKTPRNFTIDPTGNYLLAANQDTDNIVIFKRDKDTGLLQPTGNELKIPKPVFLSIF